VMRSWSAVGEGVITNQRSKNKKPPDDSVGKPKKGGTFSNIIIKMSSKKSEHLDRGMVGK